MWTWIYDKNIRIWISLDKSKATLLLCKVEIIKDLKIVSPYQLQLKLLDKVGEVKVVPVDPIAVARNILFKPVQNGGLLHQRQHQVAVGAGTKSGRWRLVDGDGVTQPKLGAWYVDHQHVEGGGVCVHQEEGVILAPVGRESDPSGRGPGLVWRQLRAQVDAAVEAVINVDKACGNLEQRILKCTLWMQKRYKVNTNEGLAKLSSNLPRLHSVHPYMWKSLKLPYFYEFLVSYQIGLSNSL